MAARSLRYAVLRTAPVGMTGRELCCAPLVGMTGSGEVVTMLGALDRR